MGEIRRKLFVKIRQFLDLEIFLKIKGWGFGARARILGVNSTSSLIWLKTTFRKKTKIESLIFALYIPKFSCTHNLIKLRFSVILVIFEFIEYFSIFTSEVQSVFLIFQNCGYFTYQPVVKSNALFSSVGILMQKFAQLINSGCYWVSLKDQSDTPPLKITMIPTKC